MSYIGELYEPSMSTENYEEGSGDKIIQLESLKWKKQMDGKLLLLLEREFLLWLYSF